MFDSFANFFTTVQLVVIVGTASFITGVFSSQKVKDWLAGVPSDLRSALKSVEGDALGRIKAAQVAVLNDIAGRIHGTDNVVKAPLAAAAPVPVAEVAKTPLPAAAPAPVAKPVAVAPVVAVASPAVAAAAVAAVDAAQPTVLQTRAPVLPSEGAPITPPVV